VEAVLMQIQDPEMVFVWNLKRG